MDQDRLPLPGAQEVGVQGVAHNGCHGPRGVKVLGGDPAPLEVLANDNAPKALTQVGQGGGQGENDHDLTGRRNVEGGLTGDAVDLGPQPGDNVAQGAVIDVQDARPGNGALVNAQGVAVIQVVVDHCRQ